MKKKQCLPIDNFGVLLIDFLQLYGIDFNYFTTGIAVAGEGRYFKKTERDWFVEQQPQLLSIEDPNDPGTFLFPFPFIDSGTSYNHTIILCFLLPTPTKLD
jgi:hypothetical protein